jgi:hypothetical protein
MFGRHDASAFTSWPAHRASQSQIVMRQKLLVRYPG